MTPVDEHPRDEESRLRVSLVGIFNVILREWKLVAGIALAVPLLFVAAHLLAGPLYVAESQFKPQARSGATAAQFASVAAQFGLNIGAGAEGETPDFYADLARSRDLLQMVATTTHTFRPDPAGEEVLSGTIIELYEVQGDRPEERERRAVDRLLEDLTARVNIKTGVVTLRVEAPWAGLAEALNTRILELLNEFNVARRQSQAAAERRFVESRLEQAQQELEQSEDALEQFLMSNRRIDSPELQFQRGRLQRRVDVRQQVFLSLAQGYEQARIEEVRDIPVLTVTDSPSSRSAAPLSRSLLSGLLLGPILALALVFGRAWFRDQRVVDPSGYAEFRQHRRAMGRILPGRARKKADAEAEEPALR